jgi:xanthine dehydrogenase small subunit
MRQAIRFLRRGEVVELNSVPPMQTLLDYLRLDEKSRGTKEGCNEGDCGACTVALGALKDGRLVYEPVNACILLVGQIDGKELVTVDDLAVDGTLHPVQQALVDYHGSQCGFCTPGFVMALFTLYQRGITPTRQQIVDQIAGNLCRCTGYRPIVNAALASCHGRPQDRWALAAEETERKLTQLKDDRDIFVGDDGSFFAAPASVASLCDLALRHPEAALVSGATDVGLWITKQLRELPKIIHLGRAGLDVIQDSADLLSIGATVTYEQAEPHLRAIDPDLGELVRRLGSKQVRASGTVGGNIANGSPIGDMPPALIALGAQLHLRRGGHNRNMALEDFFIDYGKQDRQPGEIVTGVYVPKLREGEQFRCYKISKRFDQDISAVMGAFKLELVGRHIAAARVAYGGMAATPKRAKRTEAQLAGLSLDHPAEWPRAIEALSMDFEPISDMRASAAYRMETAQALLRKALIEIAGETSRNTRVTGQREEAA